MPLRRILFLAATLAAPVALGQTSAPGAQPAAALPVFDVISVKQDKAARGWRDSITADGFSATGINVKTLLMEAYAITPYYRVIGAPPWTDETAYDIEAKVADQDVSTLKLLGPDQRIAMVQQVLTDRFKLKIHREDRNQPIYSLVVTKPGVLNRASVATDGKRDIFRSGRGQLTATNFSTRQLVQMLSGHLGRMVVDNTGLTGGYDVDLHWNDEDSGGSPGGGTGSDPSAPSIFTALQEQLGLKLVPTKGPVECLVVDHVEQPSEN